MRNSWRGQNGLPAGSLLKYVLWNTVVTPVTPVLTPRQPVPFRQYRSPPTRNRVERSPPHQPGMIPAGWKLTPLPGLTQQFAIQVEREIQKQIQECSCQLVQDVLQRSANRIMPPTPSEAARASLSQCFQKALATPRTEPAPPQEQPRGQAKGESAQYSLADPFVGINQPPPEVLKESYSDHPARGRETTCLERPPEEKKRRSSSCPRGEAEPKRGRSIGCRALLGRFQSWRPAIRQGLFSTHK